MKRYAPGKTAMNILCCRCGVVIQPNNENMCEECLMEGVDICRGVPRQIVLQHCRSCERFHLPPKRWIRCSMESKELLELCLKKIRLHGVEIVDSWFVWSEPHSKRILFKIVVEKDTNDLTIKQEVGVEGVVQNKQCGDCEMIEAEKLWNALVQIRQRTENKRTLLYLEQLVIARNAHRETSDIKTSKNGMDFYFVDKNAAARFSSFLEMVLPMKKERNEKLVSSSMQSGTRTSKVTCVFTLPVVCREDLVCLSKQQAGKLNTSRFVICQRIRKNIHLLCPETGRESEVTGLAYWKEPFRALQTRMHLRRFHVLEIESTQVDARTQKQIATVYLLSEDGVPVQSVVRTCLGVDLDGVLLGYDLRTLNTCNDAFNTISENERPDIVIVKRERESRGRLWKLPRLDMLMPEDKETQEVFMQEIEEDKDVRREVCFVRNEEEISRWMAGEQIESEIPIEEILQKFGGMEL
uniref:60S ribosomal export protein NMD3 n=1 Tax=Metchnikovella dogieli TaxID=2804710 RepID=A0A896WCP7_9MICR|nr:60S ribosomal export protein NMD3 [Metchnikovella dogieli]